MKRLQLPASMFKPALKTISVSFSTRPVLHSQGSWQLPIPSENGYDWAWVEFGKAAVELQAQATSEAPSWGYSEQNILEGWLNLKKNDS